MMDRSRVHMTNPHAHASHPNNGHVPPHHHHLTGARYGGKMHNVAAGHHHHALHAHPHPHGHGHVESGHGAPHDRNHPSIKYKPGINILAFLQLVGGLLMLNFEAISK